MIKYRVNYYESDGWSADCWDVDYDTEQEAHKAFKECEDKYMNKPYTPDYYIRPVYIGEVIL